MTSRALTCGRHGSDAATADHGRGGAQPLGAARRDRVRGRAERGWRPIVGNVRPEHHLNPGTTRRGYLDPYVEDSICELIEHARAGSDARSIALIRVRDISGLSTARHPGWTPEQQAKIDGYLNQLDILDDHHRTPLQAPRFTGSYRYRCADAAATGRACSTGSSPPYNATLATSPTPRPPLSYAPSSSTSCAPPTESIVEESGRANPP
jgi:hypothetical protein